MSSPLIPAARPVAGWDIAFTRMVRALSERFSVCLRELSFLLGSTGLSTEVRHRVTPVGFAASMHVTGSEGLLCSIEFNVVDAMMDCRVPALALDVNLLAADGEVVAFCTPMRAAGAAGYSRSLDGVLSHAANALSATSLYACIVEHFDLVYERVRKVH